MLTCRPLLHSEWPLLLDLAIEPFASCGLPDRDHWIIVGAFDGEALVAISALYETVHNDPWWIAPGYRRSPSLVAEMWRATKAVLDEKGVEGIHVTVRDDQPEVQAMVERLGYTPAPGKLYILRVADAVLNRRS